MEGMVSPQAAAFSMLRFLTQFVNCKAVVRWCQLLQIAIASSVEDNLDHWGDHDWCCTSKALPQGGQKRRRVDFHLKQHALQVQVNGCAPSVTMAAKSVQTMQTMITAPVMVKVSGSTGHDGGRGCGVVKVNLRWIALV